RAYGLFDYRSFTKRLLARAWFLYEVLYLLMMILVISVLGAAAGSILHDAFGLATGIGTIGMMVAIGLLVFYGTPAIERFLVFWSFILYAAYIVFLVLNFVQHGDAMQSNLAQGLVNSGWAVSGVKYAGYNLASVPVLLFCIRHLTRPKEAISAGLIAGPIAMIPAVLFFLTMIGQYESLMQADRDTVPVSLLLSALAHAEFFAIVFPIVLFGTFIETGAAMIHGVNERIGQQFEESDREMPRWMRPAVALAILIVAIVVADVVGLTDLIARGYGVITYGFLLVFVLPALTWGVWQIAKTDRLAAGQESA
ncbi:MAG: hypothetical protein ACE5KS_08500, partial [Woeseiaceae bacterium]